MFEWYPRCSLRGREGKCTLDGEEGSGAVSPAAAWPWCFVLHFKIALVSAVMKNTELELIDFTFNSTNTVSHCYTPGCCAALQEDLWSCKNNRGEIVTSGTKTCEEQCSWVKVCLFGGYPAQSSWVVCAIGNLILQSPKFDYFAMLGGALWPTGAFP